MSSFFLILNDIFHLNFISWKKIPLHLNKVHLLFSRIVKPVILSACLLVGESVEIPLDIAIIGDGSMGTFRISNRGYTFVTKAKSNHEEFFIKLLNVIHKLRRKYIIFMAFCQVLPVTPVSTPIFFLLIKE